MDGSALAQAVGDTTTLPGADLPPEYTFEAGDPIQSGVTGTGAPTAEAYVIDVASGTYTQHALTEEPDHQTTALVPQDAPVTDLFLENANSLAIVASATATPDGGLTANADAQVLEAISQIVAAPNADLTATLINSGDLLIGADASATGTDETDDVVTNANASMIGGLYQSATVEAGGDGTATVTGTNDGTYTAYADAQASSDGDATASATVQEAIFARAQANGNGDATSITDFTNNGDLDFWTSADSTSSAGSASATASTGGGEHGLIHIRAQANGVGVDAASTFFTMTEGSTLGVAADATATGLTGAEAAAIADGTIVMKAQASGQDDGDVTLGLLNDGDITIVTNAQAAATGEESVASALSSQSSAILQVAEAGGPEHYIGREGIVTFDNVGTIAMSGTANASSLGYANAQTLFEAAILQEAEMTGVAETHFANAGTLTVEGSATASAQNAEAFARGTGIEQELFGLGDGGAGRSTFANDGDISVVLSAEAIDDGGYSGAAAEATGYKVWGEPINLDVTNGGNLTVGAQATAGGPASAQATGMSFLATWDPTIVLPENEEGHGHGGDEEHGNGQNGHGGPGQDEGPVVWEEAATNAVQGTILNGGTIAVSAYASGSDDYEYLFGAKTTQELTPPGAEAIATGVYFEGASVNVDFTNSGLIQADAASSDGISEAYGIRVADFAASPIEPGEEDVFSFLNDGGSIIARKSYDLGETWVHGLAIDTSMAPNRADFVFQGGSYVYGNIDISADDTLTVATGMLTLDGIINPDEVLEGTLTVNSGATLYLTDTLNTNPDYDGPAGGYLDTFTMEEGATLALQLPVTSVAGPTISSAKAPAALSPQLALSPYQQIITNVANIGGTLEMVLSTPNGLYDDHYFWDNVIDANVLNGTFDDVVTTPPSMFLDPGVIYDGEANVDLELTRVPFDDNRFGLTPNQLAAAGGIEDVYSPTLTGPFADMLAQMFLMTDPAQYAADLSTVHGAQYATYMQSLGWMGNRFNGVLSDMGECAALQMQDSVLTCRRESAGIWGTVNYGSENIDSDPAADATGYKSDQLLAAIGVDFPFGQGGVLGVSGGYVKNKGNFDWHNGMMDADGYQLGLYGAYDPGSIYLKGAVSYSALNAASSRSVRMATVAGTATASPDAHIWAAGAELGFRIPARIATATPYARLDWVSAELQGFTEGGAHPGRLIVHDSTLDHLTSELGLKLSGKFGGIMPEAKAAWRHAFGASPAAFSASFAEEPGSVFRIIGPDSGPDMVVAGFSLSASLTDCLTGRLGYSGRYGSGVENNALYGSLLLMLGGASSADGTSLSSELQDTAKPTLKLGFEASGVYDDNIFATRNDKVTDFIAIMRPSARMLFGDRSTYLEVGGRGELARNANHTSENYSDWTVDWDSRIRLNDGASFILNGDYAWAHEVRTSPEAVFGLVPTRYQKGYGIAALLVRQNGWIARLAASGTTYDFNDTATTGGSINNDDRDRTETEIAGRLGHSLADSTDLFAQLSVSRSRYESAADDFGYDRNSHGISAVVGLQRGNKDGLSGEIFAGLLQRSSDDPRLNDIKTFDLGVLVNWAGKRSDASFRVDRGIGETTFPGATAYVQTGGSVAFSAAAGPRLAAGITLRGTQYDYVGILRQEFVIGTELWARYWLDKHLYAGLGYDFTQRASNVAGYNYDENRLLLTLGTQLQPRYLDSREPVSLVSDGQAPAGAYAAILMGHGTLVSGVAGPRDLHEFSTADFGDDGAAFGAAIGYGVTFDPVYLGVEFSATADGPAWQHEGSRVFSVEKDNAIELAARAGFVTPGHALVYGRFGYAAARFTTAYDTSTESVLLKDRKSGMGVGFGIEAQASGHAFLRAEYVINAYRDYDVTLAGDAQDNFSNVEGQFRLGFGFRLGKSSAAPPAPTDFSGAYAGMALGHGTLISRTVGARDAGASLDATRSSQGGVLGIFAGYGFTTNGFYLGAEIEGDLSSIDWNSEGGPGGRTYSVRRQNSYGAAARLGHAIGPSALFYGRIGVVRTGFDTQYQSADFSVSSKDTMTGLQLGAGLEIGLSGKVRLQAEYIKDDYNNYDIKYANSLETFSNTENIFRSRLLIAL